MPTLGSDSDLTLQQFDLSFVDVHRVRRFRFSPRHCQSDSDLELMDQRDGGKHQIFSQICRDHPACGCAPFYSSWNCDGEILNHTAIDVRYAGPFLIVVFSNGKKKPQTPGLTEAFSVCQGSLPPHQAVRSRHRGAGRVQRRARQPPCTLEPPLLSPVDLDPVVSAAPPTRHVFHDLDFGLTPAGCFDSDLRRRLRTLRICLALRSACKFKKKISIFALYAFDSRCTQTHALRRVGKI